MGLMDIRRRILADAPVLAEASGAVASFSTDMAVPLKKCEFAIEPVQSGTGDPSPTNVRPISGWTGVAGMHTGANVWDEIFGVGRLEPDGTIAESVTSRITTDFIPIKPNTTYSVHIPAASAGRGAFYGRDKTLLTGRYYADFPKNSSPAVFPMGTYENAEGGGRYFTFISPPDAYYLRYCVYASYGTTYNNDISINYPATDTAYHQYTGEQIAVEFPALGKNLVDVSKITGTNISVSNGVISVNATSSGTSTSVTLAQVAPSLEVGQTYTLSMSADGTSSHIWLQNGSVVAGRWDSGTAHTMTQEDLNGFFKFYNTGTVTNFQIEKGSTATSYEPYTNTVYGGTVDPTTGVLTVDKQHVVVNGDTKLNKGGSVYYGDYGTNTYVNIPSVGFSAAEIMYKPCYADKAQKTNAVTWVYPDSNIWKYAINAYTQLHIVFENTVVGITSGMTADERLEAIKTWLTSNPMHFVLPLATPKTYQLTSQQITALKGQNNVWCDTGNTTVKYWKH